MARWHSNTLWPKRAVVTAGMPYGNKALHFGHIAGVFVPADCFARFLRDRIGAENVRFVSGTDCYGSPINEGYRKAVEAGSCVSSIAEYVQGNHESQKATLDKYAIDLNIYEGSGIGVSGEIHQDVTDAFIEKLYAQGHLKKQSTLQFYDIQANTFLNGRQVEGYCPVQGCKSTEAYADECALGHQYAPEELIAPRSKLTDSTPEMRPVENWYFDLPSYNQFLHKWVAGLEADTEVRPVVSNTIKEFLVPPVIYIKTEFYDDYAAVSDTLPRHVYREVEKGKHSFEVEFENIEARDKARDVFLKAGIRFRTSKALVPFRISGNIEWGVKAPTIEGLEGLTVWCWPESLWAPISFTMAEQEKRGLPQEEWREFWCADDAEVYQFIGQDNLYFYGVVQPALFEAIAPGDMFDGDPANTLKQTKLIANYHILYGDKKASSTQNPPTADELLDYYTPEQLRAHFLALGLGLKSVGFKPKPFELDEKKKNDSRAADPVLKESALLTNIFNRLARSCFYEAQKNFEGVMPLGSVSSLAVDKAHQAIQAYEEAMHKAEFHTVMSLMDEFIRWSQKYWADQILAAEKSENHDLRRQTLIDSFYLLRISTLLMHPIVPRGTEKICEYLQFDPAVFFSWEHDFESMQELCTQEECRAATHLIKELPPRTDFFEKHPSQFK